ASSTAETSSVDRACRGCFREETRVVGRGIVAAPANANRKCDELFVFSGSGKCGFARLSEIINVHLCRRARRASSRSSVRRGGSGLALCQPGLRLTLRRGAPPADAEQG